jgi:23S rRNA (uridine2552-2'-O)-methyltransferase
VARSKSSRRWLDEHFNDTFVKRAQREGMRSRAAYKLSELLGRDLKLKPGMVVVDLGAAPGGWSQVVARTLGGRGRIIALDLLPMEPIAGVEVMQGDFTDEAVLSELNLRLSGRPVDLVLSDMAPNWSGMAAVDIPRAMGLAEAARDFALQHLGRHGGLVLKLFQGEGFDRFLRELKAAFARVVLRKPEASRSRSREIYALATDFLGRVTDPVRPEPAVGPARAETTRAAE